MCKRKPYISENGLYVRHTLFVGLQYTRYPLKAICEWVGLLGLPRHMRHSQACRPLVQYQLPRINDLCQLFQECFNGPRIRNQIVYDLRPCLVQALVPDARRKELDSILEALGSFSDVVGALVKHGLPEPRLHEVHLVYEAEDLGARTAFVQRADDVGVGYDIGRELARLDIEDEDEDGDGAKDVVAGLGEVVFDEAVLTAHRQLATHYAAGARVAYPPQSHRLSIKFPMNLMLLCSTSMVAPSLRTSLAT
jgi:hypothetical protein